MRSSILLLPAFLVSSLSAAEPGQPNPQAAGQPVPAQPVQVRPPRLRAQANPASAAEADHNLSITLSGKVGDNRDIALSLTGVGPRFESSSLLMDGSVLSVEYGISQTEKGILVTYSLGLQVEVKMGNNTQYRSQSFNGTVLCNGDTPVEIYASGSQKLSLGIATAKAPEAPATK